MNLTTCLVSLALLIFSAGEAQDVSREANLFIQVLTAEQKSQALFPLKSDERQNWHMIPRARKGVCFRNLNEEQRKSALVLLRASLSQQGYTKAYEIMKNESLLRELEGRSPGDTYRDPLNYYLSFFGQPSSTGSWGWRLEGHHVSLNFFSKDGALWSATPSAFGSNPAIVPSGVQKGRQLLMNETNVAFSLVNSLTAAQKAQAIISETALPELITLGVRNAELIEPRGLSFSELSADQKKIAYELVDVYLSNYSESVSGQLMTRIRMEGMDTFSFAWAGSLKPGAGHYYRIQNSFLLIEYDNTQTNANHVHVAVRDLTRDFGSDVLLEHYRSEH